MNSDKDALDHMLIIVGLVCWLVFYSWGICWVWTLLPKLNDHVWWFFPMVLTSLAGLGLPLAIFIVLDKIFGWTNDV